MAGDLIPLLDERVIEEMFQGSVAALRATREQVFQIAESGRQEVQRLNMALKQVTDEARRCVQQVDELEKASRRARQRLTHINTHFSEYSEDEIREAYAEAERHLVELGAAREREDALRRRRDDLSRQLKHLQNILGRADNVVSQVGVALDFLSGNWEQISESMDGMRDQAGMARQVILAQEEERRRVARDIHDGPAQLLANLLMRVELMEQGLDKVNGQGRVQLTELQNLVRDSLQELRRIIFNLRPMALDDLGLAPALRGYVEVLRQQVGLDVEVHVHGQERRMAPAAETALFRVAQEALSNVHRHSGVKRAGVVLEFAHDGVRMSVRDSGKGYNPDVVSQSNVRAKFGLLNMRERVRLLGGTFRVITGPGQGTLITVSVPWSEAALKPEPGEGGWADDGDQSINRR